MCNEFQINCKKIYFMIVFYQSGVRLNNMYALCVILHNVCHIIHRHSMQLSTNLWIVNPIYAILVQNYLCPILDQMVHLWNIWQIPGMEFSWKEFKSWNIVRIINSSTYMECSIIFIIVNSGLSFRNWLIVSKAVSCESGYWKFEKWKVKWKSG